MGYIEDNLTANEKILYRARIHPAVFLPTTVPFTIGVAAAIYAWSLRSQQHTAMSLPATTLFFAAAGFLVWSIGLGLQAFIFKLTTEFAITNRRIIAKRGLIRRHTLEILLSKVESVGVHQGILGRLLNFGAVTVTGTGGTRGTYNPIAEPLVARKRINRIVEQYMQAYAEYQREASRPQSSG
jgi:uncharacterized membrane protein YdbT with pleckstrin-like domain